MQQKIESFKPYIFSAKKMLAGYEQTQHVRNIKNVDTYTVAQMNKLIASKKKKKYDATPQTNTKLLQLFKEIKKL